MATLIVYIVLVCSAYFSSQMIVPESDASIGSLFIISIAFFSFYSLTKTAGFKKGVFLYLLLGVMAVGIEYIALTTGIPYGDFVYTGPAGWHIFGVVPVTVPFAWVSILLGAFALGKNIVKTSAFMVLTDLVLDPVSVTLGLWHWNTPGFYYGVPLVNYAGWVLSGLVGAWTVSIFFKRYIKIKPTYELTRSLEFLLVYWVCLAVLQSLWVPTLIGAAFLMYIWIWRKKQRSL